jgi:hypothetical protein
MTSKQQKIDEFVIELKKFIDIRYEILKETDLCNHTYVIKHLVSPYEETEARLKQKIKELLDFNSE